MSRESIDPVASARGHYRLSRQPDVSADLGGHVALQHGRGPAARTLTFDEVDERSGRVAAALAAAGLVAGDRLLLLAPNAVETFEILIGAARAGVVAVPVNWRLAVPELAHVATDSGARGVVIDPALDHLRPGLRGNAFRVDVALGEQYEAWLAAGARGPSARETPVAAGDDVALQVYTSGTSGRPKGVLLTHRNLATKVPGVTPRWGLEPDAISLLATPLFHVGALSWGLVGLHAGATTILAGDASAETLVTHLRDDAVTHTFLVPALIARLCDLLGEGHPGPESRKRPVFPRLEALVYGASPISSDLQKRALDLFGPVLHQVYGMSETTGSFTEMAARADLAPDDPLYASAGTPYPWCEVEIRDPDTGAPVPVGQRGEVWTRSAQNTPGYAGAPEDTAVLLTQDGWLRTGDGGHLDASGHLFLGDRVKDLVISGGENVSPAEVEEALRCHAAVREVSVVGLPDEQWGEVVAAAVVLAQGARVSPDELVAHTRDLLAGYKCPRLVVPVDDLPRNATGKVVRHQVRRLLAASSTPTATQEEQP